MCTAYELGKRGGSFPSRIKAEAAGILMDLAGTSIIRPTLHAPVILPDGGLVTMRWGFRREFAARKMGGKPVRRTIVNSREDKLGGITWRGAFAERRCLIPAAAFYEWVKVDGENRPLRFQRPGGEWIWIAGIWEDHPEHGSCYSMITTAPSPAVESVHDRMPAVLDEGQIAPYLDGALGQFGPSPLALRYQEAPNFLKTVEKREFPRAPTQQELF